MFPPHVMHPVEEQLRATIRSQGPVTFRRFMELALYSPSGGYYRSPQRVGPSGDYFTSPAAHPLFGWLLAAQLQQMWELLERPETFTVVEAGAGSGLLSRDLLAGCRAMDPRFGDAVRSVAVDRVARGHDATDDAPERVASWGVPLRGVVGCIVSNELFDSFPVHRFQVRDGRPREVYVGLENGRFTEVLEAPSDPRIAARARAGPGEPLPEGFRGEVCLGIDPWMADAAGALDRGFVLTVDYGGTSEELFAPSRAWGMLRTYYRHTVAADPYVRVGRQDITAHVDFTELARVGERHGLARLGYATQGVFLSNLGADAYLEALDLRARSRSRDRLGGREHQANRMAIAQLLAPEGLGGFKVLVQGRGVGTPTLWGVDPENPHRRRLHERLPSLEVPLRAPEHTPLMEGRYPHAGVEMDDLWREAFGPP